MKKTIFDVQILFNLILVVSIVALQQGPEFNSTTLPGPVCVEFACSPRVFGDSLQVLLLFPMQGFRLCVTS